MAYCYFHYAVNAVCKQTCPLSVAVYIIVYSAVEVEEAEEEDTPHTIAV